MELVDVMGSDLTVVNAARVSFEKSEDYLSEDGIRLIHYLAEHGHWTPFAHPQIAVRLKMPIFVARQWMKSQVGIVINEVSRRYVDSEPEFYYPDLWRERVKNAKQGSGGPITRNNDAGCQYGLAVGVCIDAYENLLAFGVAPEMARMVLPQSMYTEFWATMSLAAAARVVGLRKDSHAQLEIQMYALALEKLIHPLFPVSWDALTKELDG